jgi:hypothetical protein
MFNKDALVYWLLGVLATVFMSLSTYGLQKISSNADDLAMLKTWKEDYARTWRNDFERKFTLSKDEINSKFGNLEDLLNHIKDLDRQHITQYELLKADVVRINQQLTAAMNSLQFLETQMRYLQSGQRSLPVVPLTPGIIGADK